ncbi:unnamed protein product, partial [marine sediment metagenome]
SLNFLFLLDRDRGNEDFYKRIENDDVREFIKDRILILFSYELENIFVQPILIIDYLNHLNIIETLNSDFIWLLDVMDDIFQSLGENYYEYLLKKFNDILFPSLKKDLKVFDKIRGEVFQPKFKLIQIEGKSNLVHYASAKILQYLDRNSLNFLFLLDRDRGNEDFYKRIENDDVREFIKDRILILFSYELENIFVQPILIIDYLNHLNIIETLNSDFIWLLDVMDDI